MVVVGSVFPFLESKQHDFFRPVMEHMYSLALFSSGRALFLARTPGDSFSLGRSV